MTLILSGTDGVSDIDGTAATPAIRGTDTNTGIFFPAADTIAFSEGGAEAMRIDSSGNVGIGTSSPAQKLDVAGNVRVGGTTGQFLINASSTSQYPALFFQSAGTSRSSIFIDDTGATFPTYISVNTAAPLIFRTDATERMRIDSSGNVGIGTSSPQRTLGVHVASASSSFVQITNTTSGVSSDSDGLRVGIDSSANAYVFQGENLPLIFGTNNTECARFTSGGWLNLRTTSASGYHKIYQNSGNEITAEFKNENATNGYGIDVNTVTSAGTGFSFIRSYSNVNSSPDLEFNLRGDGNGYADGTWNNNGADYAEFFESANGQALTLGATVVLDGNKVREATDQDPASAIIGVVRPKEPSKASMVVGNTAWNKWANKYLTDDFDRYIMEDHDVVEWEEQVLEREAVAAVEAVVDEEGNEISPAVPAQEAVYKTKQHSYESHNIPAGVTVPADAVRKTHDDKGNKFQHYKLNPAWDKDAEYVNRENRPEWNIIGLLGQVKILKGQPVGDRWIKMRDVSATVEEWMIR